jgi:hypothetical protein
MLFGKLIVSCLTLTKCSQKFTASCTFRLSGSFKYSSFARIYVQSPISPVQIRCSTCDCLICRQHSSRVASFPRVPVLYSPAHVSLERLLLCSHSLPPCILYTSWAMPASTELFCSLLEHHTNGYHRPRSDPRTRHATLQTLPDPTHVR